MDYNGRSLTKVVDTGWAPEIESRRNGTMSNVLTLWGMTDLGRDQTDAYVLSMSFEMRLADLLYLFGRGNRIGVASRDADGRWSNAVDANCGGTTRFVYGPWKPTYGLGAYGYDLCKKVAWAVLDHEGEFAVAHLN